MQQTKQQLWKLKKEYIEEKDEFISSSIQSRIDDLHEAFLDKNVKAIFTVIGGFNSNQLLRYLDWDLKQWYFKMNYLQCLIKE